MSPNYECPLCLKDALFLVKRRNLRDFLFDNQMVQKRTELHLIQC